MGALLSELQKGTVKCFVLGTEVLGHRHEQLTQTLIERFFLNRSLERKNCEGQALPFQTLNCFNRTNCINSSFAQKCAHNIFGKTLLGKSIPPQVAKKILLELHFFTFNNLRHKDLKQQTIINLMNIFQEKTLIIINVKLRRLICFWKFGSVSQTMNCNYGRRLEYKITTRLSRQPRLFLNHLLIINTRNYGPPGLRCSLRLQGGHYRYYV